MNDGTVYKGSWLNDKRDGKGILIIYTDPKKYEGGFKNGKFHGYGELICNDGEFYRGNWFDGVRNGWGIQIYPDNSKYHGDWKNDKKHGIGTFY